MKTNFEIFDEISFDYVDNNNVTFVDGFSTQDDCSNGRVLGYIVNDAFYPTDNDIVLNKRIMSIIDQHIKSK